MKKILKWIGIVIGVIAGLVILFAATMFFVGSSRLNKTYSIPADNIAIPTDGASIDRGKHLVETLCIHCHTTNLSGKTWFSFPPAGKVDSAISTWRFPRVLVSLFSLVHPRRRARQATKATVIDFTM